MRLCHAAAAENRPSIAAHGFRDSVRDHATGVFLSPPGFLWQAGGMVWVGEDSPQPVNDEAVYVFDIPDDVATEFADYEDVPFDPAVPFVRTADGFALYEFCVPAAVANKYLVS